MAQDNLKLLLEMQAKVVKWYKHILININHFQSTISNLVRKLSEDTLVKQTITNSSKICDQGSFQFPSSDKIKAG